MTALILERLAHVALWSPLVFLQLWQAWRARKAQAPAWERFHLQAANIWMAVAVITGSR